MPEIKSENAFEMCAEKHQHRVQKTLKKQPEAIQNGVPDLSGNTLVSKVSAVMICDGFLKLSGLHPEVILGVFLLRKPIRKPSGFRNRSTSHFY